MTGKRSVFLGLITMLATLLSPCLALAQYDDRTLPAFFTLPVLLIAIVFYVYLALALQAIAQKTNTENAWLAWIPIANVILMLNVAQKPLWWIILYLIPIVNIIIGILVWMAIAERRGKPSWWGVMVIVPIMNLIMPGYLAWAN